MTQHLPGQPHQLPRHRMPLANYQGQHILSVSGSAMTDDRGQYRVGGLRADLHYVSAADPAGNVITETHELMRVDNSLPYVTDVKRAFGSASTVLTNASIAQFDVTWCGGLEVARTLGRHAVRREGAERRQRSVLADLYRHRGGLRLVEGWGEVRHPQETRQRQRLLEDRLGGQ